MLRAALWAGIGFGVLYAFNYWVYDIPGLKG
jgi:hypothetical protein